VLVSLALVLLLFAWWRPQYAGKARMVKDRGIDLVIVLDYSKSMYARDIPLSRIQRAKQELGRLLDKLHGTRVGLVLFAGSVKELPVTTDYNAIKLFWGDTTPNDMPVGGTAIGLALTAGVRLLKRVRGKGPPRDQVILLITDGEDHESEPIKAAEMARKLGIRVYTLGIGSPIGELIPEILEDGKQAGYVKYDGKFVTTKLDPKTLMKIARITSGKYIQASAAHFGVDRFLAEIDKLQKAETQRRIRRDYRDSYELLLFGALLLLLLEATLGSRRWSLRGRPATPPAPRNGDQRPPKQGPAPRKGRPPPPRAEDHL
jgi:Ca-activated chloride channel family protein